jgi:hypothetical protein
MFALFHFRTRSILTVLAVAATQLSKTLAISAFLWLFNRKNDNSLTFIDEK